MCHIIIRSVQLGLSGWDGGSLSCKIDVKSHNICQYNLTIIVSHLKNHQCICTHRNKIITPLYQSITKQSNLFSN